MARDSSCTRITGLIQRTKMEPLFNRHITATEVSNSTEGKHLKTVPLTQDTSEVWILRQCPGNPMSHEMETVEGFRLKCCFFPGGFHTIQQLCRSASCSFLNSSTGTLRGAGGEGIPESFRLEKATDIIESNL